MVKHRLANLILFALGALVAGCSSPTDSGGLASQAAAPGGGQGIALAQLGQWVSLQATTPGATNRFLRHAGGLGFTEVVNASSPEVLKQDATFKIVPALDGTPCYSFESRNFPGEYLRHAGFRIRRERLDGSSTSKQDATFCAQTGLAGRGGVSFVSRNFPDRYIRHINSEVYIAKNGGPNPWDNPGSYNEDVSWNIAAPWAGTATLPTSDTPDFGPNVTIFEAGTGAATIQGKVDAAFNALLRSPTAQFGEARNTFLFKPGTYGRVWANVGYYTTLAGLGRNPDDVTINGAINVDSGWNLGDEANATQNFWRSAENLSIVPEGGTNRWAVSQAAPMRRVHIRGNLTLAPSNQDTGQGYSSGGYLADARVDGQVTSGSQQQWYTRESSLGSWNGGVWNMVFSGVQGAPAQAFPNPPHTTLATTPVSREKPYLYFENGKYAVFVPSLRTNAAGVSWPNTPGSSIPLSQFYVARPGDSAARLNDALAQGLNLFFTPGVYRLNQTLNVTRPNTVVFGLGFPTLIPENGVNAMGIADVDGVKVSGLLFDAGTVNSQALLTVGQAGVHVSRSSNPIMIQDVYFRIGGAVAGKATVSLVVHSDDTVIDHVWAWRGDHGQGIGWNSNTADTGVVVNGNNVLATGLFVEHYQKYQVVWNGQGGRTVFFQNEMPYDVPNQDAWRSPTGNGYAAYKVADAVTSHELWGAGVYCFFNANPATNASRAFEVPNAPGVRLRSLLTVSLGNTGSISNVVNNVGGAVPIAGTNTAPRNVVQYPAATTGASDLLPAAPSGRVNLRLLNATNGAYPKERIYWAILGYNPANNALSYVNRDAQLVPASPADNDAPNRLTKNGVGYSNYFQNLSSSSTIALPRIYGARLFLSVGSPMFIKTLSVPGGVGFAGPDINNPADPNQDVTFDFAEFTFNDLGFFGNTTRVDQFGFPLRYRLVGFDGSDRTVGENGSRAQIFADFEAINPPEFRGLVRREQRIVAPAKGDFGAGRAQGRYFEAYINQVWDAYRASDLEVSTQSGTYRGRVVGNDFVFSKNGGPANLYIRGKPSTQNVLEASGNLASGNSDELVIQAQIAAALNRHLLITVNPSQWSDSSTYYRTGPANFYAKFWHERSIGGLAYGFSYDDVREQSTLLQHPQPRQVDFTIGW